MYIYICVCIYPDIHVISYLDPFTKNASQAEKDTQDCRQWRRRAESLEETSSSHKTCGNIGEIFGNCRFINWLLVWLPWIWHFPRNIGNFIIPIDELIFFRGVAKNHQPVKMGRGKDTWQIIPGKHTWRSWNITLYELGKLLEKTNL